MPNTKKNNENRKKRAKKSLSSNTTTHDSSCIDFTPEQLARASELAKQINGPTPSSAGAFYCPHPPKQLSHKAPKKPSGNTPAFFSQAPEQTNKDSAGATEACKRNQQP